MSYTINPSMLILAREARGLTQQQLGEKIQLHKANISRIESGETPVSADTLLALSDALAYPASFFQQSGEVVPVNLAYRKRQKVPMKIISPVEAQTNIITRHIHFLIQALELPRPTLPLFKVDEAQHTPQRIAMALRKKWECGTGVLPNLLLLMEKAGILINRFDFGTNRVDSRSMLTSDKYPVIFLNKNLAGDRQRFTLAFELGHLLMHTYTQVLHTQDINHEANLFAAELLMPAKEISKDFKAGITLPLLGELKLKWKVSMIALLYRADDLGLLTPNQKRYLIQQFNQQKIRRREPPELDIPASKPQLMRQLLAKYMSKTKLGVSQLASLLHVYMDDYFHYYGD